jgi:hypothetical protein
MIRLVLLSVLSILLVASARGASSTSSSSLLPSGGRWLASPSSWPASWSARTHAKGPDRSGSPSAATKVALGGLRGGGPVTSTLADLPIREATLHLALASWAIWGAALAARPVETMKRSGVTIGPGGPGQNITEFSGYVHAQDAASYLCLLDHVSRFRGSLTHHPLHGPVLVFHSAAGCS